METINYSEQIDGCIVAEGRGKEVLILRELRKPIKTIDGTIGKFELENRWLSVECENEKDEAWACVQGNDFTYWKSLRQLGFKNGKSLFDCVRII